MGGCLRLYASFPFPNIPASSHMNTRIHTLTDFSQFHLPFQLHSYFFSPVCPSDSPFLFMSFVQRHAGLGVQPEHIEKLGDFSLLAQVSMCGVSWLSWPC